MINSRCPRPIGTRESTALIPVCIGSLTEIRGMIPGALIPTRKRCLVFNGPLPSMGLPGRKSPFVHCTSKRSPPPQGVIL